LKVLLDSCVSGSLRGPLADLAHDVDWAGAWDRDPGDAEILSQAHREGRVLITLDKDFGALAVLHGRPHAGIVRLVNLTVHDQLRIGALVLERYKNELPAGAIVTAEADRLRIRLPD
jgi:predicted nuclease of predicted toxin-antitoxin system